MSVCSRARIPARILVAFCVVFPAFPAAARLLSVSPQQMQRLDIRTAPVARAASQPVVSVLGHVTPAPDARVPVAAPFAGTVKSLVRLEGESVKAGDALAVIVSADMHAALAKLKGQEAHARSTRAAAQRAKALVAEGIAPASRAEEANAEAATAAAELNALRSATARASGASGGEYRLLAPAAGKVASITMAVGESVTAMQPVAAIQTGDAVWVEGSLPAVMIGQVAPGDAVRVEGSDAMGQVMAAGSSMDPKTRSAMVRARLQQPGRLVSGQTVRLAITRKAESGSFTVPRAAVVTLGKSDAVFVARSGGFESVPVRLLARGPGSATIAGVLRAGDRVAVRGVSELKALAGQGQD